ncbi:uncharacterized protein TRAVEDRAFT_20238 [Trametes versicolor FP-101664 SS1]|uniref:uncharacterized protein n=1 Tax=Trametes versicolor (strain FP-101664) TaxID=717944 RepID=UPI00046229B0|nr:uncharacterized protein TRAVEDRAFT_20238 [Trametes versicolor FP-101664 SS1]EIW58121.1 hypothetical protein TRAVEDRAFT_20238 [Trametes versicolor FP-101664 SS1]
MPVLVHNDYTSTSVSEVSCGLLFAARALASTVFVVYWGADDPGEQNMLDRRFLRLALERSVGATGANDFCDLWVAVEISDEYWHWNNGLDDDGVNKPVSAGTQKMQQASTQAGEQAGHMRKREAIVSQPPDAIPQNVFTKAMASYGPPALDVWRRLSRQVLPPS